MLYFFPSFLIKNPLHSDKKNHEYNEMVALAFMPVVLNLRCLQLKQALRVGSVCGLNIQSLSVPLKDSFVFVIVSGNCCCAVRRLFHVFCSAAEGDSLKAFFGLKNRRLL